MTEGTKWRPAAKLAPAEIWLMVRQGKAWVKRWKAADGVLTLTAHLCRPCSVGRGLEGWQCRLGSLVLQAGRASLGPGAWWTTGCMGRPLPRETGLTAVRLGHRRAAAWWNGKKEKKEEGVRAANVSESNLKCLVLQQRWRTHYSDT